MQNNTHPDYSGYYYPYYRGGGEVYFNSNLIDRYQLYQAYQYYAYYYQQMAQYNASLESEIEESESEEESTKEVSEKKDRIMKKAGYTGAQGAINTKNPRLKFTSEYQKKERKTGNFECLACRRFFSEFSLIENHFKSKKHHQNLEKKIQMDSLSFHKFNGQIKCLPCYKFFTTIKELEIHTHQQRHVTPNLTCELCNVTTTSQDNFDAHVNSKKHKNAIGRYLALQSSKIGVNNPDSPYTTLSVPTYLLPQEEEEMIPAFYCEICSLNFTSQVQMESHFNGKKHRKALKAESSPNQSEAIYPDLKIDFNNTIETQKLISNSVDEPINLNLDPDLSPNTDSSNQTN